MNLQGIEKGHPEEFVAACTIVEINNTKFSDVSALALHRVQTQVYFKMRARRNEPKALKEFNPTQERANAQNFSGIRNFCLPLRSNFPPEIPPAARRRLNGLIGRDSKPFEKQLTVSDVNVTQCRLSLNKLDVQIAVTPLLKEGEDSSQGIPVKIYDANGKEYPMTYITWASKFHVLKEGWMDFCNDHGLIAHQDFVTLWAFRNLQTGELSFVITSRRLQVFEPVKRERLNYN